MKKWMARPIALGCGVLLSLTLLELGLTLACVFPTQRNPLRGFHQPHELLGWSGVPDYSARFRRNEFDVLVVHGADGFRRGPDVRPGPSATRIAVLGDSFTWGWGVEQGATFCDRLQVLLGDSALVKNFGVNAYGTGQERLLLEHTALPWRPDVVLLMVYENDFQDNADEKGGRRPWFELVEDRLVARNCPVRRDISGRARAVSRRSRALSFLQYNANVLLSDLRRDVRASADSGTPASCRVSAEEWLLFEALLEELADLCASSTAAPELRVAYIPSHAELLDTLAGEPRAPHAMRLEEACAARGLPFLDLASPLLEAWPDSGDSDPLYFEQDNHWTSRGHRIAAAALMRAWNWSDDR